MPETNKIICGDCLQVMKDWPDNCVDLVLTDPPYGIGGKSNALGFAVGFGYSEARQYDDQWNLETPEQSYFKEILRISKRAIIWGGNYFTDKLPVSPHWLVWDKIADIQFENPFSDCELAWTNIARKSVKKHICIQQGFISVEKTRFHPTQKPLQLFAWCLDKYSKPDDLVLDCYSGSGTTCVAAKMLGRRYIGIDISEKYCEIARQRLEAVDTGVSVREQKIGQIPLFPVEKEK